MHLAPSIAPRYWIQTRGGGALDLLNPTPDMIDLAAVGVGLSRIARFAGQTEGDVIYSVAQHSVEGARAILRDTGNRDAAAAFLLHDGHEYALGDDVTPKLEAMAAIATLHGDLHDGNIVRNANRQLRRGLDAAIYGAAGIAYPLPVAIEGIVKEYDIRMCRTERDARLAPAPYPWGPTYENAEPVAGVDTSEWPYALAVAMWNNATVELLG